MVSILICSTNSNNYKKPAYDNGFYAKSHFVDNVCCSITNNETSRNCSISAPVRLTSRAKLLSQMNPIAGSMSVDSRSVEIQARPMAESHIVLDYEQLTALSADLTDHADSIENITAHQLETDIRRAAQVVSEHASWRFVLAE